MIQQQGNVWIQQTIKLQHKAKLMFSGQLHKLNYSALMDTGGSVLSPRNNICQLCVCLSNHITHIHKEMCANCAVILKNRCEREHGPDERPRLMSAEAIMEELDTGEDGGKGE